MTSASHSSGYYAAGPKKSSPKLLVILTQERFGPITILSQSEKDYRYTISDLRIQHGPSYEVRATWVPE